jgi:hypothetical protein
MRAAGLDNALQNWYCLAERKQKQNFLAICRDQKKMLRWLRRKEKGKFKASWVDTDDSRPGNCPVLLYLGAQDAAAVQGLHVPGAVQIHPKSCLNPGSFPMLIMFPSLECNRWSS